MGVLVGQIENDIFDTSQERQLGTTMKLLLLMFGIASRSCPPKFFFLWNIKKKREGEVLPADETSARDS